MERNHKRDTLRKHSKWVALCLVLAVLIGGCLLQEAYAADVQIPYPIALSEEEIQMFNEGFFNITTDNMNNMLLTSEYAKPEEIDLFQTFYNGIGEAAGQISEEEIALLTVLDSQAPYLDIVKVTVTQMEEVLQEKLGIGLEEAQKINIESAYYLEQYDSFYIIKGDTNFDWCTVISGNWWSDSMLTLEYEKVYEGGKWIVTLRYTDYGYQFVSNQKCIDVESGQNFATESDILEYKIGIVTTDQARVRSSADINAMSMFALNKGMKVKILAMENDFYKIAVSVKDHNNGEEIIGFIQTGLCTTLQSP